MPIIRSAEANDAELLRELEETAGALFRTIPEFEWLADEKSRPANDWRKLIENELVWIAEDDVGNPQGFLAARLFDQDLFIVEISVRLEAQGQGIGGALMGAALDRAHALGCRAVTLSTFRAVPWNAPAYMRVGYHILDGDMTPPYLRAILDKEVDGGLIRGHRCAMELVL